MGARRGEHGAVVDGERLGVAGAASGDRDRDVDAVGAIDCGQRTGDDGADAGGGAQRDVRDHVAHGWRRRR